MGRELDWEGCANVRDLGGLGRLPRGRLVRADEPDLLQPRGWEQLRAYGIRTLVDLRHHDERRPLALPDGVVSVHLDLDGHHDHAFWDLWGKGPQWGTPIYYRPFLDHFGDRVATAMRLIARAAPGGVLFHCVRGRDRTGLISLMLLSLAGASGEEIVADYLVSRDRLPQHEETAKVEAYLVSQNTSAADLIRSLLDSWDVAAYLLEAGLSEEDLDLLLQRLR